LIMPGHSLGTADPDTVAEAVACNVQATTKQRKTG